MSNEQERAAIENCFAKMKAKEQAASTMLAALEAMLAVNRVRPPIMNAEERAAIAAAATSVRFAIALAKAAGIKEQ